MEAAHMNTMMTTTEAARALSRGARSTAEAGFSSVSTDSRTLQPGALFVALRGERFDGHEFLAAVRERGAAAAMVDESGAQQLARSATALPAIVVEDTRRGLGQLAARWRARFDIPLVAVTGSNGKTTVKEMIAAILRAHYGASLGENATLATEGNFNNDIGLPLTLLRLREHHACAVVEIGMNHPGETRHLAAMAAPTVALINNAQREHQEFMASVADVAREHGDVFAALQPGGTAVINADDEYAEYWRGIVRGDCSVRDFGVQHRLGAAVTGRYQLSDAGSAIALDAPEGQVSFALRVPGLHNVRNAVAAAAAATAAGAGLHAVAHGLSSFSAVQGRLQRKVGRNGAVVIDDTYNANPDSVRAAIDVLALASMASTSASTSASGERVLVLGDMGEVGEQGPDFHAEIGRYARERGVTQLLLAGEATRHTAVAFGKGARHFERVEDLLPAAAACDAPGATVLVKGSRFMRMERAVVVLTGENDHTRGAH
jgi:UDP-N-acetylmuramoyl-tripeptide--D-alanyl-D-alanine ligase